MFSKKCKRCGDKIKEDYNFCPACGVSFKSENMKRNWGILGNGEGGFENNFQGFGGGFLDRMIGSTLKLLESELNSGVRGQNNFSDNLRISINGKPVLMNKPSSTISKKSLDLFSKKEFPKNKQEKLSKLPRVEPSVNIKRFSDKIVYEFAFLGVKSFEDVLLRKLESGIEIKAIAKDKVYVKTIIVKTPLINYSFSKGILSLEFAV